jgi:hypothetical protein
MRCRGNHWNSNKWNWNFHNRAIFFQFYHRIVFCIYYRFSFRYVGCLGDYTGDCIGDSVDHEEPKVHDLWLFMIYRISHTISMFQY